MIKEEEIKKLPSGDLIKIIMSCGWEMKRRRMTGLSLEELTAIKRDVEKMIKFNNR